MENKRNEPSLTPRPGSPGALSRQIKRDDDERRAQRSAKANRIYKNRRLALGAIGLAMVAAGAAGGGRMLLHDIEKGGHDTASDRVEVVSNAFSDPNPGVITGEPTLSDAERTVAANQAHNAALRAAKAAEAAEAAQTDELPR